MNETQALSSRSLEPLAGDRDRGPSQWDGMQQGGGKGGGWAVSEKDGPHRALRLPRPVAVSKLLSMFEPQLTHR